MRSYHMRKMSSDTQEFIIKNSYLSSVRHIQIVQCNKLNSSFVDLSDLENSLPTLVSNLKCDVLIAPRVGFTDFELCDIGAVYIPKCAKYGFYGCRFLNSNVKNLYTKEPRIVSFDRGVFKDSRYINLLTMDYEKKIIRNNKVDRYMSLLEI